jgi:sialate O-acetylesterase
MITSMLAALALLVAGQDREGQGRPFLHPLLTDHVVLQRDQPIPIWGWSEPGQRIKVVLAGQSVETTVGDDGRWLVRLGPYPAGGPHVIQVTGPKTVEVRDVLVGDVWLCSGQSNMEWSVASSNRPEQEIAAANYPRIRLFSVPRKLALEPQQTIDAHWDVCSPETVGGFSAVGYFFGRELERDLAVPIGLINASWGGTVAEAWTSEKSLGTLGDFSKALTALREERGEPDKAPIKFADAMAAWWKKNDPGSSDPPGWADPKFDATGWKTMDLPGTWDDKGLKYFDGILWYRRSFELPESWKDKELVVELGPIDDRDTTFLNGVEIGHMETWNAPRRYKIAAGVARAGQNLIAVRVLDTASLGGFAGGKDDLKIMPSGETNEPAVSLAGPWQYREAASLSNLSAPPDPAMSNPNKVTVLYNGLIAPLLPFPIKGAIWYQGESNTGRAEQYRRLLPTMIRDWRESFGVGEFPFYIVQLANYMQTSVEPGESAWAELREAQSLTTRKLPHVGITLTIDIGEANDIHPRNKQEVGRRLALAALAQTYGKDVEFSGPSFRSFEVKDGAIRLAFDHVGAGLVARGGKLESFAIAGEDGKFVWADAVIDGDTVVVRSPNVPTPKKVRYDWADNPVGNLYNQAGLPAMPFRTDPPEK